jgi:hypothetical protein
VVDRMAARPEKLDSDVAMLRRVARGDRNGAAWFTLGALESCVQTVARSHQQCDETGWCGVCNAVSSARESLAAFDVVTNEDDAARAAG